jgi:hypothetical protein
MSDFSEFERAESWITFGASGSLDKKSRLSQDFSIFTGQGSQSCSVSQVLYQHSRWRR